MSQTPVDTKIDPTAQAELAKLFALAKDDVPNLTMPSSYIDSTWHEMIKEEAEYERFCQEHAGVFVRHAPFQGEGEVTWIQDYEERFGDLPAIWFTRADGTIDDELRREYQRTGRVMFASWDCGPLID